MSQLSQSQRKRKSQSQAEEKDASTDKVSLEDWTKKCVRYFLTRMSTNVPIKRADIVKNVFLERPGKNFELVLEHTVRKLKKIYGLNIEVLDTDTTNKKYVVTNRLPYAALIPQDPASDMQTVTTFLVLTHVFMSKNNATDISLWQFLKEFDIFPETNLNSVSNMKMFITQTLVRQHYIVIEDRGGEHDDGEPKKRLKWGARAEEVVSKMEILKFVAQLYGNKDVQFWSEHYKTANEQFAGCEVD